MANTNNHSDVKPQTDGLFATNWKTSVNRLKYMLVAIVITVAPSMLILTVHPSLDERKVTLFVTCLVALVVALWLWAALGSDSVSAKQAAQPLAFFSLGLIIVYAFSVSSLITPTCALLRWLASVLWANVCYLAPLAALGLLLYFVIKAIRYQQTQKPPTPQNGNAGDGKSQSTRYQRANRFKCMADSFAVTGVVSMGVGVIFYAFVYFVLGYPHPPGLVDPSAGFLQGYCPNVAPVAFVVSIIVSAVWYYPHDKRCPIGLVEIVAIEALFIATLAFSCALL